MPIKIGKKVESDFTNPLGLMADCHRRIENFLQALITLTDEYTDNDLQPETRSALTAALKYFQQAAPRHTADEEESLFPRLGKIADDRLAAVLTQLDSLHHDHLHAEQLHNKVDELGQQWLAANRLTTDARNLLKDYLMELQAIYQAHIAIEEGEIFPFAQTRLAAADIAALGSEMAARRGIKYQIVKIASEPIDSIW